MTNYQTLPARTSAVHSLYQTFIAFPVACFSLTVLTDIAYWQTANLLWLHFSEWLLLAGLVFGGVAAAFWAIGCLFGRLRGSWLGVLGAVVTFCLAVVNSFVHTADGWTAVVPYGLSLSILTVLAMIVTAFFGRTGERHV